MFAHTALIQYSRSRHAPDVPNMLLYSCIVKRDPFANFTICLSAGPVAGRRGTGMCKARDID